MISYTKFKTELHNLSIVFDAIKSLNKAISHYSEDKPGPAYFKFEYFDETTHHQIQRKFMVEALEKEKNHLIEYLKNIGIDYDEKKVSFY